MDAQLLVAAYNAARTVSVQLEPGVVISMLVPTQSQADMAALVSLDKHGMGRAALAATRRAWLQQAVCAWVGVLATHFLDGVDPSPVDFEPDALALMLDVKPEWVDLLTTKLDAETRTRNAVAAEAKKNLLTTLPGENQLATAPP